MGPRLLEHPVFMRYDKFRLCHLDARFKVNKGKESPNVMTEAKNVQKTFLKVLSSVICDENGQRKRIRKDLQIKNEQKRRFENTHRQKIPVEAFSNWDFIISGCSLKQVWLSLIQMLYENDQDSKP